ncbi:hypothetical protein COBT_001504 [Conglomerata obtusa]
MKILQDVLAQQKTRDDMFSVASKIFFCEIGGSFLLEFKSFIFAKIFGRQIKEISMLAFKNAFKNDHIDHEEYENGIVQNEIVIGSKGLAKLLNVLIMNILPQLIGLYILIRKFDWEFGSVFSFMVFVSLTVCTVLHVYMVMLKLKYQNLSNESIGKSQKVLYESFLNAEMVKCCGTERYELNRYKNELRNLQVGKVNYKKVDNILTFLHRFIFSTLKYVVFYYYIFSCPDDNLAPKLAILKSLLGLSEINATRIGTIYMKLNTYLLNSSFVYKHLQYVEKKETKFRIDTFYEVISISNLTLRYDETLIFKDFNCEISTGDKIALVGKNGMGKTSLLKCFMKLNLYEGYIEIDHNDIEFVDTEALRNLFSYVPQNICLFDETIYYNILYGTQNKSFRDVVEICDKINLTETIKRTKDGFFTNVGENGCNLSGGMRQKIIIARAMLRDANILLMDEPTSNIDDQSREIFFDYLLNERKKDTLLMIVHEKSNLKKFNRFFYFDNHRIYVYNSYDAYLNAVENK